MHDPTTFDEPFEFKPERYLTKGGKINTKILSPEDASFGYGRRWASTIYAHNRLEQLTCRPRICPGRHLSHETLSIMVLSLLSCFDIMPAKDEAGRHKPLELKVTSSIVS
jgi:cytochrome P450